MWPLGSGRVTERLVALSSGVRLITPAGGAAVLLALGAVPAFGDAIFTDGFGVRLPPRVGAEHGVIGFAGQQTIQNILEVGPDVQVIVDGAADQGEEVRGPFTRRHTADE